MTTYAHLAPEDLRPILDQIDQARAVYQQTRDPVLIDRIAQLSGQAISFASFASAPVDFQIGMLIDAGNAFFSRFRAFQSPADIGQAIDRWQEALALIAEGDATQRARTCFYLGSGLINRYLTTFDMPDLEQAIDAYRQAIDLLPLDSPSRSQYLLAYADNLTAAYQRSGNQIAFSAAWADLSQAIDSATQPDLQNMLWHRIGILLSERFSQTGELAALDDAAKAYHSAMAAMPSEAPDRVDYLNNLGAVWRDHYTHTGLEADLQTALNYYREAVRLSPPSWPNRAVYLTGLGISLHDWYLRSSNPADLDEAIKYCQSAYQSTPSNAPYRFAILTHLADCLSTLYRRDGNLADLDQSLAYNREALELTPHGTLTYAVVLNNVGNSLISRYRHTHEINTLQEAVNELQQAAQMTGLSAPGYAVYTANWGNALMQWSMATRDRAALDRAVKVFEYALKELPPKAATRANVLNLFSNALSTLFYATADRADLDRAIDTYQAALDLTPLTSPERFGILNNLGLHLCERYALAQQPADLAQAVVAFRQVCVEGLLTAPADVLNSGRNWGTWALERSAWDEAAEAFGAAIRAAEQLFSVQLRRAHKQAWLREAQGLYSLAAFAQARIGNWQSAVVMIEHGRARLLSEVLERDRADLERLQTLGYTDQYQQYVQACRATAEMESIELQPTRELRPGAYMLSFTRIASQLPRFDKLAHLRATRDKLDAAIGAIRTIPGYQDFLRLPDYEQISSMLTARLSDRQAPPIGVYLAMTDYGGFALIHHHGNALGVWLDVTRAELESRLIRRHNEQIVGGYLVSQQDSEHLSAELDDLLPWLGRQIVQPMVAALKDLIAVEDGKDAPTLIMIPAGVLAQLPLHAAPYLINDQLRTLLDDFPVAYSPSAHVFGQCIAQLKAEDTQALSLLAIGNPLPLPAKIPELPYAAVEVEQIARLFGVEARVLQAQEATVWATESGLEHSNYLHFACHGQYQTERPLASGLLLSGGDILTLAELFARQSNMKFWRLVVLSACQSALTDQVWLPEEAIGLPAGFLQAGALGVIGSLWSVSDLSTSLLMLKFYELHLKSETPSDRGPLSPARALQRAQVWLRDVTYGELTDLFDRLRHDSPSPSMRQVAQEQFRICALRGPDEKPYAHPYYWAPFVFYGG